MDNLPEYKFAIREDLLDTGDMFLPKKAEPEATGYDVRCATEDRKPIVLRPGQYCKIPLGFRAFCPKGWWFKLVPRSSSFIKKSLHALYGTVDETYENIAYFCAQYLCDLNSLNKDLVIEFGEAIGQIIPVRREEMLVSTISNMEFDNLCKNRNSVRKGGFGSTGN